MNNTAVTPNIACAVGYYRLSVEEANNGESGSITNQRAIVQQYCTDHNILLVKEFVDDGFSGSNFDRPGFQDMLAYIDKGLVNTVITKDLSRLGRDMTESSHYAEVFFPERDIRYIAISDNFDSGEINLMAPFQFAMNDVYLRDTSRKIKQVLVQKRKNGEYCACPPFGYMRNPKDRTTIVPDPQTAPTVQRIFELATQGESAHGIAAILTKEGYTTPLKYRVLYRDNFCDKGAARATDEWNHTTVKRILKNQVYLGHTVLGKTKKASLKSKKIIPVDRENWSVTLNTHTPLVSQEQFDTAQQYLGIHSHNPRDCEKPRTSIFNGIVFCENCGGAMCSAGTVYKGEREKYWYLSCNNIPKRSKCHCENGARIRYADLIEIAKSELNAFIALTPEEKEEIVRAAIKKSNTSVYQASTETLAGIEKRINDINKIIMKLYNDNVLGLISDDRLAEMVKQYNAEASTLKERAFELQRHQEKENGIDAAYRQFFKLLEPFDHIDELTPEIVRMFIKRIDIGKKELPEGYTVATHDIPFRQKIKITYRFIGNIGENERNFNDEKMIE